MEAHNGYLYVSLLIKKINRSPIGKINTFSTIKEPIINNNNNFSKEEKRILSNMFFLEKKKKNKNVFFRKGIKKIFLFLL